MERVDEWLGYARPDVLLMQETKMSEDQFPHDHFAALGYESVHSGEGRWNGVAILSSVGIEEPYKGFADGGEDDDITRAHVKHIYREMCMKKIRELIQ